MVFKDNCVLVQWTKVATALKGLKEYLDSKASTLQKNVFSVLFLCGLTDFNRFSIFSDHTCIPYANKLISR